MQSDTIIGIAGAVVLVAVMVGVFAYEYNNAPDEGDGNGGLTEEQRQKDLFNATYPTLDPDEDIDGDGTPNWNDTDLDDDGIPNGDDNTTCFCDQAFDGTVPASSADDQNPVDTSNTFTVGTGVTGGEVTVTWSVTRNPATEGPIDDLTVSIEGLPACTVSDGGDGRVATCDLSGIDPDEYPKEYAIRVAHAGPVGAQEKSFSGTFSIVY